MGCVESSDPIESCGGPECVYCVHYRQCDNKLCGICTRIFPDHNRHEWYLKHEREKAKASSYQPPINSTNSSTTNMPMPSAPPLPLPPSTTNPSAPTLPLPPSTTNPSAPTLPLPSLTTNPSAPPLPLHSLTTNPSAPPQVENVLQQRQATTEERKQFFQKGILSGPDSKWIGISSNGCIGIYATEEAADAAERERNFMADEA